MIIISLQTPRIDFSLKRIKFKVNNISTVTECIKIGSDLKEIHFRFRNMLKVNEWEKLFYSKSDLKSVWITTY